MSSSILRLFAKSLALQCPSPRGGLGKRGKGAAGEAGGGVGCIPPMDFWSRCLGLSWSVDEVCVVPTRAGARGDSCTDRSHLQTVASPADTDPDTHGLGLSLLLTAWDPPSIAVVYVACVPSHIHCLSLTLILTGKYALVPNRLGRFIGESERPMLIFLCGFSHCLAVSSSSTKSRSVEPVKG